MGLAHSTAHKPPCRAWPCWGRGWAGTETSAEEPIVQKLGCCWDRTCVSIISCGKGAPAASRASHGHLIGEECRVLDELGAARYHDHLIAKIVPCTDRNVDMKTKDFSSSIHEQNVCQKLPQRSEHGDGHLVKLDLLQTARRLSTSCPA